MERVRSRQRLAPAEEPLLPKQQGSPPNSPPRQPPTRRRPAGFLMAFLAAIVTIHVSASLLAGEPLVEPPGVAWADLQLGGDSAAAGLAASLPLPPADPLAAPSLIPRIIHHLFNATDEQSPAIRASYSRWHSANPGWEMRFYQEDEAADHVGRWFPQYAAVYSALRSEGERRDLFRYLAVLRHGGLFADAGVGAPRPLVEVVRPEDTMVAAWDAEFPSGQAAISACHVRARQLQHGLFAAAPGHPALAAVVDRVAATLDTQFSMHPAIDAAERTGPGVFTDAVLKHARDHPPAMAGAEGHWGVRLLPRKAFGDAPPAPCEAPWDAPAGGAQEARPRGRHADRGSSSSRTSSLVDGNSGISSTSSGGLQAADRQPRKQLREGGGSAAAVAGDARLSAPRRVARWWSSLWSSSSQDSSADDDAASWRHVGRPDVAVAAHLERLTAAHEERQLFPVSASFEPPFDVMTHLVSHGERQSGWDVSQTITAFGSWQPSVQPGRRPSLAEALVGSLGVAISSTANSITNSSSSIGKSSGNEREKDLVFVDVGAGYGVVSLAAAARGHKVHAFELGPGSASALEAAIERNGFGPLVQLHRTPLGGPAQRGPACLELHAGAAAEATAAATLPPNVEMARGYSDPAAHSVTGAACARSALRLPGAEAVPPGERVGALRVSANGWEGHVIEGFLPLLRTQRPPVIALEWSPAAMRAVGYPAPLALLRLLLSLGYDDVSHSGFICDERWYAATYGVRRTGGSDGERPEDMAGLAQPTWCRLLPEDYTLLLEKANSKYPETLLFINKEAGRGGPEAAAAAAAVKEEASERSSKGSTDVPGLGLDAEENVRDGEGGGVSEVVAEEELAQIEEEVEALELPSGVDEGATATEEELADGEEAVRALAADAVTSASLDDAPEPTLQEQQQEEEEDLQGDQ